MSSGPALPGSEGFPGSQNFNAKAGAVLDKLGQLVRTVGYLNKNMFFLIFITKLLKLPTSLTLSTYRRAMISSSVVCTHSSYRSHWILRPVRILFCSFLSSQPGLLTLGCFVFSSFCSSHGAQMRPSR